MEGAGRASFAPADISMKYLSATYARKHLIALIDEVGDANVVVRLAGRRHSAVLISLKAFEEMRHREAPAKKAARKSQKPPVARKKPPVPPIRQSLR